MTVLDNASSSRQQRKDGFAPAYGTACSDPARVQHCVLSLRLALARPARSCQVSAGNRNSMVGMTAMSEHSIDGDLFGPVISSYTDAEALADGVLIRVPF